MKETGDRNKISKRYKRPVKLFELVIGEGVLERTQRRQPTIAVCVGASVRW